MVTVIKVKSAMESIPLFPLSQMLLPGCSLPLQIFEQRYLSLISHCLKSDSGFGVVLIRDGREVGQVPQVFPVGVYARIVDWHQLPNGLLGITVQGERKFRILNTEAQADQLLQAAVEFLAEEPICEIPEQYLELVALVQQLSRHPAVASLGLPAVKDGRMLGWQLTQLLPLSNPDKVALLALQDPLERLQRLVEYLDRLPD